MEKDLLGYALKALEPHEQAAVEAYLHTHPEAQVRLEAMRHALEPLSWDPQEPPAPDLAARTLALLPPVPIAAGPAPGDVLLRTWRPTRRLAELVMAASAAVLVVGAVVVWIARARQQAPGGEASPVHVVECKANLQKLYIALHAYADLHNRQFPNVAHTLDQPQRNVAGLVYPILYDARLLTPDVSVRCPGAVGLGVSPYNLNDVRSMGPGEFDSWAVHLRHSYAYSLGYKGTSGMILSLRLDDGKPMASLPLMADSAPRDPRLGGNSPHHGGLGQNVLYCDGHVAFVTTRNVGLNQDDIYLNRAGKVGAGLDWSDTVLSSSLAVP
jgi:prepilin-type processing-associated H-X9-DG protein